MTDSSNTPSPTTTPDPSTPNTPTTPVSFDPAKLHDAIDAGIARAQELSDEEIRLGSLSSIEQKIIALLKLLGIDVSGLSS